MASNQDISRLFSLYAELLQLHEQEERLTELLSGAAYRIQRMDDPVLDLDKAEAQKLFRPHIVAILYELASTSTIANMDELVQLTPSGLFDMMRVKGLGGKKLALLWKTGKIDTLEDLLSAAKAGKLHDIPGFGAKTEKNIIAAIEGMNSQSDHFHFADVADPAASIVLALQKLFATDKISLCGEIRRHATTVEAIEILAAITAKQLSTKSLKKVVTLSSSIAQMSKGFSLDEVPVTIYHCAPKAFFSELFKRTGSGAHVDKVLHKIKLKETYASEAGIYAQAKLPYIEPEMREGIAEWQYAAKGGKLIENRDIRGVVHNHTDWSDGVDSLAEFVLACKKKKFEYVVISDHSKNAHYAGGLKPDKVLRQFEEIDKLNNQVTPFRIFKSIECDILVSGELDYEPSLLKQFDLVIISIHQLLKMNEERATARLLKAIENPYTTILGHMTGRQLLIRSGYPVDFKKVIDACAANQVVIELNANPYRLDMDWSHIPYAIEKGVMVSINPDAHSIHEIDNIRWGVSAARKGGLTKDMTWNAMPLKKIQEWLKAKRPARAKAH
jgi:DNA polymerase (family 10)